MMNKRVAGKRSAVLLAFFIACMAGLWVAYSLYGHAFIRAMYEGESIGLFNRFIGGQELRAIEVYYRTGDLLFSSFYISLLLFGLSFIFIGGLANLDFPSRLIISLCPAAFLVAAKTTVEFVIRAPYSWWNASRLAWMLSPFYGYQLYYAPGAGPAMSSTRNPLAAVVYFPSILGRTPTQTILIASAIAALIYYLPVLFVHLRRKVDYFTRSMLVIASFLCFCLFSVNIPSLKMAVPAVHSDAPAIGIGALACLFLYYRKYALSALFAVLAFWTKQAMMPLALILVLYVFFTESTKIFKRYLLSVGIFGTVISALIIHIFGLKTLFFNLIAVPIRHPGRFGPSRLTDVGAAIITFLQHTAWLFLLVLLLCVCSLFRKQYSGPIAHRTKSWLLDNPWALFTVIACCMIPVSLAGYTKKGGTLAMFAYTTFFLALSITLGLQNLILSPLSYRQRQSAIIPKYLLVLLLFYYTIVTIMRYPLPLDLALLRHNDQEAAYAFAKEHKGEIYYPNNVLSTLMAEGKHYHFNYGLLDREGAGFTIRDDHFRSHIPERIRYVAFPGPCTDDTEKYVLRYLPEFTKQVEIDELPGWIIYEKAE